MDIYVELCTDRIVTPALLSNSTNGFEKARSGVNSIFRDVAAVGNADEHELKRRINPISKRK
jgi:hypothetical protein